MTVFLLIAIWFVATCCLSEHQRRINEQRQKEQDSRDWYEAGLRTPYEPAPYDHTRPDNPPHIAALFYPGTNIERPLSAEEIKKALRGEVISQDSVH